MFSSKERRKKEKKKKAKWNKERNSKGGGKLLQCKTRRVQCRVVDYENEGNERGSPKGGNCRKREGLGHMVSLGDGSSKYPGGAQTTELDGLTNSTSLWGKKYLKREKRVAVLQANEGVQKGCDDHGLSL